MSIPDLGRRGFGAAGIGNLYKEMSDDVAAATIEAGRDAGLRYFDTAPHYVHGRHGRRQGRPGRDTRRRRQCSPGPD